LHYPNACHRSETYEARKSRASVVTTVQLKPSSILPVEISQKYEFVAATATSQWLQRAMIF
jgi:hypothetical protein